MGDRDRGLRLLVFRMKQLTNLATQEQASNESKIFVG